MKEFTDSKKIKTNYYAVSTATEGLGRGLVKKLNGSCLKDIQDVLNNKELEFTLSDPCDHIDYKVRCTYKIVKETIVTYKEYEEL